MLIIADLTEARQLPMFELNDETDRNQREKLLLLANLPGEKAAQQ